MVRGRWREESGLKSQVENKGEAGIGRSGWREDGRLKSQIENSGEELMKRGRWEARED